MLSRKTEDVLRDFLATAGLKPSDIQSVLDGYEENENSADEILKYIRQIMCVSHENEFMVFKVNHLKDHVNSKGGGVGLFRFRRAV